MEYQLKDVGISYEIRRYARSKHLRISIDRGGNVLVTGPKRVGLHHFHSFVDAKRNWIVQQVQTLYAKKSPELLRTDREHFDLHKDAALALAKQKVAYWNRYYGFSYGSVRVKLLKSRWGSCSSKGNLNFSYRILFLPEHLQDYLVVHELCHIKEMNHSHRFWRLVGKTIPEYSRYRKDIQQY